MGTNNMAMMQTSRLAIVTTITVAALVFILDSAQGGGTAVELLYVVPVTMIALWSSPRDVSLVIAVAGVSTVFSLAGFPKSAITDTHCFGILSHLLVIGAIWLTAALSVLRKRKERTTQWIGLSPVSS